MGSFGGHALPGSFFIIFGLHWAVQFYRKLFESMRQGGTPFTATSSFTCSRCSDVDNSATTVLLPAVGHPLRRRRSRWCSISNVNWEGVIKIVFSVVGFFVEVIFAVKYTGRFTAIGNGQHATMFFFFGISGLVDILVKLRSPVLPPGSEYMFGALAFTVEALLFKFHLHGRSTMDVLVHTFLIYVLYATVIVILLEAKFRHVPMLVFVRAFLVLVQGTWFWQVGFILYKPLPGSRPWNQEDHNEIMVITLMFAWHIGVVLTIMILIGACVYSACYRGVIAGDRQRRDERALYGDRVQLLSIAPSSPVRETADKDDDGTNSDFDSRDNELHQRNLK